MSKYETGFYKGENILTESDPGKRWCDHMNNISVEVEFDKDWNPLDKFSVVERLRGNKSHKWASGMKFEDAADLAERLVVGKDYIPPSRKVTTQNIPYIEYEVGDTVPGDFHLHTFNPRGPGFDYTYVDDSRMEIDRGFWLAAHTDELSPNKSGVIVSRSEEDIPEKIMVVYSYDDRYFSAMLRREKESMLDFYGRMGVK